MDKNIVYIRWAAKVLKVVMVINLFFGLIAFVVTVLLPLSERVGGSEILTGIGLVVYSGELVSLVVNAFITYTAARGLELLADIAYHLLATWQHSKINNS